MKLTGRPAILIGGGGHARVLIDLLRIRKIKIAGIADAALKKGSLVAGVPVLGSDTDIIGAYKPDQVCLINAVGCVRVDGIRKKIFDDFKKLGFKFHNLIHPSSIIARDVVLGEGVQIMAGAVIQTGSMIGNNTIINTRASVDHDCQIAAHVHIAPGVILCGGIKVGEGSFVGTGAVLIQNISIDSNHMVPAGATIARSPNQKGGRYE